MCEYDAIGNPTKYRGRTLTWQGRRLVSYGKENKRATYTYDVNNIRTSKTVTDGTATITSKYIYDENTLIAEQRNGEWIYYIYGVDGIAGFNYNGVTYLYRKNIQGDITHIYTLNGECVAIYAYDAFGNVRILQGENGIGAINPFRYRGYYYDTETGLYYLITRYYDPETGRFISADSIEYLDPKTLGGLNLYAYCGNNPIMYSDPNGTTKWWEWVFGIVVVVAAVVLSFVTAGLAAPLAAALGGGLLGSIVAGAAVGALGGAIAGLGISLGSQGITNGFDNINWNQVFDDTFTGAASGAIAGGIFGGFKYVASASKIANSLSGLAAAQKNADKALFVLQNTSIKIAGGVMVTERIVAQLSYNSASVVVSSAQSNYNLFNFTFTQLYRLAQFGFKSLVNNSLKG